MTTKAARKATPANSGTRSAQADATRLQIIKSALHHFSRYGYEGASVMQIAKDASVPQPLINYHFGGKEALWRATVDATFVQFRGVFDDVAHHLKDLEPLDALKVTLRRHMTYLSQHPELAQISLRESLEDTPRMRYLFETHIKPFEDSLHQHLLAAQSGGKLKPHRVRDLYQVISGGILLFFCKSVSLRSLHGVDTTDAETVNGYTDVLLDVLFNGMLVRSDVGGTIAAKPRKDTLSAPVRKARPRSKRSVPALAPCKA